MCAICPTSLLRRLVHLDVLDDQIPRIQTLGVGIGFCILEQTEEELGGFDGPAGFGDAELFACVRKTLEYEHGRRIFPLPF